jgi:hypothetical protein
MGPAEVREHSAVNDAGANLLRAAMQQLHMSARAYHGKTLRVFLCNSQGVARIPKLARTIADLAGSDAIGRRIWRRRSSTDLGGRGEPSACWQHLSQCEQGRIWCSPVPTHMG